MVGEGRGGGGEDAVADGQRQTGRERQANRGRQIYKRWREADKQKCRH